MNHLHIFQRIFFTILAAMTIMLFPYAAFAAETTQEEESEQLEQTETVYFYDEGTVLTDNAFQDTLDILEDTASQTEMYIGVWLGSRYRSEYSTENLCDDTYDEIFGTDTDGVFLYLDCSDSNDLYDYISTSGLGQFYYSNDSSYDRISAIFEEMDPYLVRGQEDLSGAIQVFCDNLIRYKDAGAPSHTISMIPPLGCIII